MLSREPSPDDVLLAVPASQHAMNAVLGSDWGLLAGTPERTCRRTLDYLIDATVECSGPARSEASYRLPPWGENVGADSLVTLLWTTGRTSIEGQSDVSADWYWQCAPLSERGGAVKRRSAPPASIT
jgi:hypothetical protein